MNTYNVLKEDMCTEYCFIFQENYKICLSEYLQDCKAYKAINKESQENVFKEFQPFSVLRTAYMNDFFLN